MILSPANLILFQTFCSFCASIVLSSDYIILELNKLQVKCGSTLIILNCPPWRHMLRFLHYLWAKLFYKGCGMIHLVDVMSWELSVNHYNCLFDKPWQVCYSLLLIMVKSFEWWKICCKNTVDTAENETYAVGCVLFSCYYMRLLVGVIVVMLGWFLYRYIWRLFGHIMLYIDCFILAFCTHWQNMIIWIMVWLFRLQECG